MRTRDVEDSRPSDAPAWVAVLLLLLMPVLAACIVSSVQRYLGGPVNPPAILMVASLALFVYASNGLSDGAEDAVNDPVRAGALRRNAFWTLALSGTGLVVAALLLAARAKLHSVYLVILAVGVAYSFPVIPHPRGGGRQPLRLKDVFLLKNVSIGATWAGAVFLAPVLDLESAPRSPVRVAIVGLSYALLTAVNSLFSDVRDEPGDRAARIDTVPVRLGAAGSFRATFIAMAIWTACLGAAFAAGVLDLRHLIFLGVAALGYPLTVWFVLTRVQPNQTITNAVIESSDIIFAVGLIALSR